MRKLNREALMTHLLTDRDSLKKTIKKIQMTAIEENHAVTEIYYSGQLSAIEAYIEAIEDGDYDE